MPKHGATAISLQSLLSQALSDYRHQLGMVTSTIPHDWVQVYSFWVKVPGKEANVCCTVIGVGILSLATRIPTRTLYGETPVRKLQLFRTAFRPHRLLFYDINLSTLTLCNSTGITLHVSTYSQHVSFIMLAKYNHAATVVCNCQFGSRSLVGAETSMPSSVGWRLWMFTPTTL